MLKFRTSWRHPPIASRHSQREHVSNAFPPFYTALVVLFFCLITGCILFGWDLVGSDLAGVVNRGIKTK